MKNSNVLFAALLTSTSTVLAQIATCDGNQAPNWEDCDTIYNYQRDLDPGVADIANMYPLCTSFFPPPDVDSKSLNCVVQWCPEGPDVRESFSGIGGDYNILSLDCRPQGAGGGSGREGAWTLQVFNNQDYDPSTSKRDAVPDPSTSKRDAVPEISWAGGPPSRKRQAQDDTGFTLVVTSRSVEREGIQISGGQPAGGEYMLIETDEKSTSVSVSTEVGAGFYEFFSASVGTSVTAEQSTSNTIGISLKIACDAPQRGQVFWYPLYDVYSGFTTPSGTDVDVVVPQDSYISSTNYRVKCIG